MKKQKKDTLAASVVSLQANFSQQPVSNVTNNDYIKMSLQKEK